MPDSMFERVAALVERALDQVHRNGSAARVDEGEWAKQIIAAMRAPTDQMVDAGFNAERDEDGDMAPRSVWEAMIDAALAENA